MCRDYDWALIHIVSSYCPTSDDELSYRVQILLSDRLLANPPIALYSDIDDKSLLWTESLCAVS